MKPQASQFFKNHYLLLIAFSIFFLQINFKQTKMNDNNYRLELDLNHKILLFVVSIQFMWMYLNSKHTHTHKHPFLFKQNN
jgi:hypothetical protein